MLGLLDLRALQAASPLRPARLQHARAAALASAALLTSVALARLAQPAAARRAVPWAAGRLREARRRHAPCLDAGRH